MRRLTAEQIGAWGALPSATHPLANAVHVDWRRPFAPEAFTQLYFTPVYRELTRAQRLRYNQLFGLRINEQFQVFESGFTVHVMRRVHGHPALGRMPALRGCVESLIDDETRHAQMFRRLNRLAAPSLYAAGDAYFTRIGVMKTALLWLASRATRQLVSLVWFIMLMEEYANALSRAVLRARAPADLGALEPSFLAVHRAHLADEARHVHVDANLIDVLLDGVSDAARARSARWLHRFLRVVLAPRHVGQRVVDRLLRDCPELRAREHALRGALSALRVDPVMASVFQDAARSPLVRSLGERFPEFDLELADPGDARAAPGTPGS